MEHASFLTWGLAEAVTMSRAQEVIFIEMKKELIRWFLPAYLSP